MNNSKFYFDIKTHGLFIDRVDLTKCSDSWVKVPDDTELII